MSAFIANSDVGVPTWAAVPNTDGNFTPLSETGQVLVPGGYGLGGYGLGPYGEGESTTISINLVTVTTWTNYSTR